MNTHLTAPPASSGLMVGEASGSLRHLLRSRNSPQASCEYVVELYDRLGPDIALLLRYVPDRLLLDPTALPEYLLALAQRLGRETWPPLEELAAQVLDDLNNELVPCWVEIILSLGGAEATRQRVLITDSQPGWDNPGLIARLPSF